MFSLIGLAKLNYTCYYENVVPELHFMVIFTVKFEQNFKNTMKFLTIFQKQTWSSIKNEWKIHLGKLSLEIIINKQNFKLFFIKRLKLE